MATGFYEIGLQLYSLSSLHLETRMFYTVLFDVDQRQVELPQKKSTNQPGIINFNESMSLRVTYNDLERARNEGKLTIYSIHHYGRKKLFGNVTFKIDIGQVQQLKLKLQSSSDDHAYIEFRCRTVKIESRVSSRQHTQSSFLRHDPEEEIQHRGEISILEVFKEQLNGSSKDSRKQRSSGESRKETSIDDIRTTVFQLPYRATGSNSQISPESISKNLSLMQSYENALKGVHSPDSQQLQQNDYQFVKKTSSKALVLQKISAMTSNLNSIHEKEDLLKDDDKIEMLIKEEEQKRKIENNSVVKQIAAESESEQHQESRLKLESHTIDFVYDKLRAARMKVHRFASDDIRHHSLQNNIFSHEEVQGDKQTLKQQTAVTDKKIALIKPKTRNQSLQEWQNDDNLVNIVHEMINDVKGNLGYVKLSKLSQLRKKIKETKDRNKNLLHSNEILIQSERFLTKKLQIAEEIITQKQKLLATQFQSLRQQFKQVTKKLLQKYNEQVLRENKMKQYQNQIKNYEKQVKDLEEKLELKNKQVIHLKKLLAVEEQAEKDKEKNVHSQILLEISNPNYQSRKEEKEITKDPRFKRVSSANKLFRSRRDDSDSSRYERGIVPGCSQINTESKKTLEMLKGITPTMTDFFMTFIAKPEEPPKSTPNTSKNNLKKARFHHQKEAIDLQNSEQVSIDGGSRIFLQI